MSGIHKSIGYADEVTYGTFVPPTIHVPLVDESLMQEIERLESEATIAGAQVIVSEQWSPGNIAVGGDVGHELFQQNIGLLFKHMFGDVQTSGAGPFTHVFSFADLAGQSFSTQAGKPQMDNTVVPFSYAGCKISEWEIAASAGEIVTLGLTVLAQSETRGEVLVAPSLVTGGAAPFTFVHGTTVDVDSAAEKVREITISCNNGLTDERRNLGDPLIDEPLQNELREVTGDITIEFRDQAHYDRFVNGAEFPLQLVFDAGANASVTLDMNIRYDGSTPETSGTDLTVVQYPYKAIMTTPAANDALVATVINDQATV